MNQNNRSFFIIFIVFLALTLSSTLLYSDEFENDDVTTHAAKRDGREAIQSSINFFLFDRNDRMISLLYNNSYVKSGYKFLINIKSSASVYLYIVNIDAGNTIYNLFPHDNIDRENPINKNQLVSLPGDEVEENALYEFDNNVGRETYYVFVSIKPIEELESIQEDIPVDGLKLNKNSTVKKTLQQLYKKSKKNIQSQKSNTISFKGFYGKKLVLNHR